MNTSMARNLHTFPLIFAIGKIDLSVYF